MHQKRIAPSAERNKGSIGAQLKTLLPAQAHVLEIASGTGQHGAYFTRLRPDISWQYSDMDANALDSQKAHAADNPAQLQSPCFLNVIDEKWWRDISPVTNIYCANMIHIAPWSAAKGLAHGAGKLLHTGSRLFLYGPFLLDEDSAQSNLDFDKNLKQRNPEWGVRQLAEVRKLFKVNGLVQEKNIDMPRDNSLLVFSKT